MKIKIAKNSGFCFGVRRAIDLIESLAKKNKKIYTNGPVIHNPQVIAKLARKGVVYSKNPDKIKSGILVIRTHGVKKNFNKRVHRAVKIVDATCPIVKRAQEIVKKLSSNKYKVIILGDCEHPEVEGLISYANEYFVVKNLTELKNLKLEGKVGFLSQTTQSRHEFEKICKYLTKKNKDWSVFDTICRTTADRQTETGGIARQVDLMIIVGGKNSANTNRLAKISSNNTATHHIETYKELRKSWFSGVASVGISAGASTPDWIISEVVDRIKKNVCQNKPTRGLYGRQ